MDSLPEVQEKDPRPPGLLPKRLQSWLLVGVAVLMVTIMWLTGGKKTQTAPRSAAHGPSPAPAEVSETTIADLQNRIEELQRQQMVAQNALAQQTRLLGSAPQGAAPSSLANETTAPSEARPEDPIEVERKRRVYLALFASNIALSFRPGVSKTAPATGPASIPPVSPADVAQVSQLLTAIQNSPMPAQRSATENRSQGNSAENTLEPKEEHPPAAVSPGAAAGKTYLILEGTILDTVLMNRLDGQFSGPIECLLSNDVYSLDRQHLLIPAGSKLLGEAKKVDTFGQTRLAVLFHRLIMPDGYSASLDQFEGLEQTGETGLHDQVNNHYLRIFGTSLAIGALGAVAEGGTAGSLTPSSSDLMRQGFAQSTAQSSAQILDKFLNVLPTVTIREGHRVKVFFSGDLALPDYTNHQMPSDL